MLRGVLFVLCVSLTGALHEDEIKPQMITPEEYLSQVTESVDAELEQQSMFAHKPPTRWYKTNAEKKHPNQKLEQALALTLVRHYNYLVHLRRELRKINNDLPGHVDLWPLHPIKSNPPGDAETGHDHSEGNEERRFVGWQQPEWMDDLFHEEADLRNEIEDLMED